AYPTGVRIVADSAVNHRPEVGRSEAELEFRHTSWMDVRRLFQACPNWRLGGAEGTFGRRIFTRGATSIICHCFCRYVP
uniref:Short-chain dehydrogenase n=1 Tax=Macrostomum lignano TaxID=282301 RepID=A0A1I8G8K3_9PLAT